ncbi:MAG: histidinol phosphatase [Acidobacteriota bacterium]
MQKQITLGLVALSLVAISLNVFGQKPLGVGRKYSSTERLKIERLQSVHADRLRYRQARHPVKLKTGLTDYRAIMHAHAEDSSHTGGTRPELLEAAKRAGVKIIMLTDHVRPERDFINDSWRGLRDGVLFIPGAEHEGFLVYPQASIKNQPRKTRDEYIRMIKAPGGNIFLSHVEERPDWDTSQLDGIEIYNHHSDIKDENTFYLWLMATLTDAQRLNDFQTALNEFPEEVFGAQQDYLAGTIAKWDKDLLQHRVTGVAANDCHHNQIFTVTCLDENTVEIGYIGSRRETRKITKEQAPGISELTRGRKAGELIAKLDLDIYDRSLNYVNTHILTNRLDEPSVREALQQGHAYVAHNWLCEATGFAFIAEARGKRVAVMGDEVKLVDRLKLRVETPVTCSLKLIRNGEVIETLQSDKLELALKEAGVYRVEAWLTFDGEARPWIYSNPIYVR